MMGLPSMACIGILFRCRHNGAQRTCYLVLTQERRDDDSIVAATTNRGAKNRRIALVRFTWKYQGSKAVLNY